MNDTNSNKPSKTDSVALFAAAFLTPLAVVVLWIVWWIWFHSSTMSWNDVGGLFAPLSCLYAGLSITGLLYTMILQQRTILMQKETLHLQEQQLEQAKSDGTKQRFENTFFQLLDVFNQIAISLEAKTYPNNDLKKGRDLIHSMAQSLIGHLVANKPKTQEASERVNYLEEAYEQWYDYYDKYMAQYFRVLYRLIRFIEDTTVSNKVEYYKIVRAQLSTQELILLFYNSFFIHGHKMRRLVIEHRLLKHLSPALLAQPDDWFLYPPQAYDLESFT